MEKSRGAQGTETAATEVGGKERTGVEISDTGLGVVQSSEPGWYQALVLCQSQLLEERESEFGDLKK